MVFGTINNQVALGGQHDPSRYQVLGVTPRNLANRDKLFQQFLRWRERKHDD
jgi:hypothetical protein